MGLHRRKTGRQAVEGLRLLESRTEAVQLLFCWEAVRTRKAALQAQLVSLNGLLASPTPFEMGAEQELSTQLRPRRKVHAKDGAAKRE